MLHSPIHFVLTIRKLKAELYAPDSSYAQLRASVSYLHLSIAFTADSCSLCDGLEMCFLLKSPQNSFGNEGINNLIN